MEKLNIYYTVLNTDNNRAKCLKHHHTTVKPDDGVDYHTMFKTSDGTSYNLNTPNEVVIILERAKRERTRLILDYGDVKTGKSWGEVCDIVGYVGRTCGGIYKCPILVYNQRSWGGGIISDNCIVKISESKGKRVLYEHPTYQAATE